jgi:hypothetical protein
MAESQRRPVKFIIPAVSAAAAAPSVA